MRPYVNFECCSFNCCACLLCLCVFVCVCVCVCVCTRRKYLHNHIEFRFIIKLSGQLYNLVDRAMHNGGK